MIDVLPDLPSGVLGFELGPGHLHAEDYRDVLLPALERAGGEGNGIRLVLVVPEFDGMSGGALRQDLKLGAEHLRAWKRVALVTDLGWMSHLTGMFGWMVPGETRVFPLAERAAAVSWATAS